MVSSYTILGVHKCLQEKLPLVHRYKDHSQRYLPETIKLYNPVHMTVVQSPWKSFCWCERVWCLPSNDTLRKPNHHISSKPGALYSNRKCTVSHQAGWGPYNSSILLLSLHRWQNLIIINNTYHIIIIALVTLMSFKSPLKLLKQCIGPHFSPSWCQKDLPRLTSPSLETSFPSERQPGFEYGSTNPKLVPEFHHLSNGNDDNIAYLEDLRLRWTTSIYKMDLKQEHSKG